MHRRDLVIFADHYQFFLQDEPSSGDLSDAWTEDSASRLLAVGSGVIGVGTASNENVPVAIEVLEHAPAEAFSPYDQVNECSLVITQGPLVVAGWADHFQDAARVPISADTYRVRVSYLLSGQERYLVQLWPSPAIEPTVVKARAA